MDNTKSNCRNKTFFLTGCASGVGAHLTSELVSAGARVFATDINWTGLQEQQRQWPKDHVFISRLDITSCEDWAANYRQAGELFGQIDVHMNIAGYLLPGELMLANGSEVHRHFDINVKGLIFGCQYAARQMQHQYKSEPQSHVQSGHIINFCSLAGIAAVPGIGLYSASKFAVRGFSLAFAEEMRAHGIAVTVVCPDAIQTPMLDLQKHYKEAAFTFSGNKFLTVEDISRALFRHILIKRPLEANLPRSRAFLAKLSSCFPALNSMVAPLLRKKGLKNQQTYPMSRTD